MRKLCAAVDRFAMKHPRFGIPNLMKYIVIGNVLVYLLAVFAGYESISFLAFSWADILHGEIWRVVTFIFMPGYYNRGDILWLALFLYLYYSLGTTLEREWGTAKFSLYYLSGVVLTILSAVILSLALNINLYMTGVEYVNLSLFLAFATLYPEARFIFIIFPIKAKWLLWLDIALYGWTVITNLLNLNFVGAILPVVALLNYFVFFWIMITNEIGYMRSKAKHQTSRQTIHFKTAARQQKQKEAQRGYRHKCAVCGRTDTDYPDLEFRYCSRCAGYHCFCTDHIFSHEHFTE